MSKSNGLILGHTEGKASKGRGIKALFDRYISDKAACQRFLQAFQRKPQQKHLVRLTNAVHTAVFAPSGAGKNISIVEPFLLTSDESCIVTDIKGENAKLTADFRQEVLGQKIIRLDPWRQTTDNPARCNVLDLIDPNDSEALDKIRALAEAIVEKKPNDQQPHWPEKAEKFIAGAIAAVVHFCPPEFRSLQDVAEILADKTLLAQVIAKLRQSTEHGGLLARMGNEMALSVDKELDGILSTANRSLAFLGTPAVVESTRSTSDFDLSALYEGNGATIYLVIPLQYLKSHAPLMRLWVTAFTKYIVSRGIGNPCNPIRRGASMCAHPAISQEEKIMDKLCKYFLGPIVVTFVLTGVFEAINPPSWPKGAVIGELVACWMVIAVVLGREMEKEEKRQKEEEARRFDAELKSKEQVELEKHRLTLEAQQSKQEVVS